MSESTVFNVLARHGIARRSSSDAHATHRVDQDYFQTIDTEEKAYWLGFLAADGHVCDRGTVRLTLAEVDADHVRRFAAAVGYTGRVEIHTRPRDGRRFASVSIRRQRFAAALVGHGIVPRKTWSLEPWQGPPELMRHYWRGLVDGDGCIAQGTSTRGRGIWTLELVGTQAVAAGFADFLCREAHIKPPKVSRHSCKTVWRVRVGGIEQPQRAVWVLYADSRIALPRKRERAESLLAAIPERSHLHLLTVGGVTKPLKDWAAEHGLKVKTLLDRVKAGDDVSRLFRGLRCPPRFLTHDGVTLRLTEWSRRTGINHQTISARLARGLPPGEALSTRGTRHEC